MVRKPYGALILTAILALTGSCKGKLSEADRLDLSKTPVQTVEDMFFVQTENGRLKIRVEAPVMEHYDKDTISLDLFPSGLKVFGYTQEGLLETTIRSDKARHEQWKKKKDQELWLATGNVIVTNVVKQEVMETDTLYWDQGKHEIYTDCYIKMRSPSGMMQGYGMRSDEMARNSVIMNPFDSWGYVVQDTTEVIIDTANFIGPVLKK